MVFGWATNCLPAALPARFALVVAAYSDDDKDLIAASGKYRSPVLLDGLPDLVRHFWSPQSFTQIWLGVVTSSIDFTAFSVLREVSVITASFTLAFGHFTGEHCSHSTACHHFGLPLAFLARNNLSTISIR
jgi:hypothetical protein